jgi:hypothetical protein
LILVHLGPSDIIQSILRIEAVTHAEKKDQYLYVQAVISAMGSCRRSLADWALLIQ